MNLIQVFKKRHWVVKPYHIALAGIGDTITTTIALSMGMPEANPLVEHIFHAGNIERFANIPFIMSMAWLRYEGIVYLDRRIYKWLSKQEISPKALRRYVYLGLYMLPIMNAIQIGIFPFLNGRS